MPPLFVVGDVHGHRDVFVGLLLEAGLLDDAELHELEQMVEAGETLDVVGALTRIVREPQRIPTTAAAPAPAPEAV